MEIQTQTKGLREALANRWRFLWRGWARRGDILGLCDLFDALPQQERELRAGMAAAVSARAESQRQRQAAEQSLAELTQELAVAREQLTEAGALRAAADAAAHESEERAERLEREAAKARKDAGETAEALTAAKKALRDSEKRCHDLAALAQTDKPARDALHLARLEIEDLQKRLEAERGESARRREHVERLWRFIAVRHRVDLPAEPGSIRHILQRTEA